MLRRPSLLNFLFYFQCRMNVGSRQDPDISNSLISDWINNPKFSCTPPIRILAHNGLRGPDRVPDDTKSGQKNTPYRTPLKGKYNAPQFDRFRVFATNNGDNFRGGQNGFIFVFTTGL
jgi:hypothetical protein